MNEQGNLCLNPLIGIYHEGTVCPPHVPLYSSVFSQSKQLAASWLK